MLYLTNVGSPEIVLTPIVWTDLSFILWDLNTKCNHAALVYVTIGFTYILNIFILVLATIGQYRLGTG